ncbi:hypothetical protein SERLA73DRAFT_70174 [Serpula lacrymans var. lacrymans S7.3]|uniref:Uncharacterized protein n=2 Tax=Serpula lacrymans var. lacrymans TaxID=341189 RepID=F8PM58_SERL3|nr:uncharacterized protein SERLADRAFT_434301 [Serpula lacrymans var. lacrymans S7.9]EGO02690.1 hypothetical protein SERLA73DRAFT_70174 [Serpula lacrymans var. lacrymans S7.3]EGO28389.1 hypothetical protein SERLADRAFT_434301 [Serpula lacrymans var. lacrymans S7.9]
MSDKEPKEKGIGISPPVKQKKVEVLIQCRSSHMAKKHVSMLDYQQEMPITVAPTAKPSFPSEPQKTQCMICVNTL